VKKLLSLFALSAIALSAANPASNMKLTFSDEFDGDKLDATKWATQGEPTAITTFKAGKITGIRITLIKKEDMIQSNGVHTRGKFEQVRGYFEASMRMNGYKGHGGTMSLRGPDDKVVPFINALWESTGADRLVPWARYVDDKGQHDLRAEGSATKFLKAGEPSKKFNTYGILWTEKAFTWFVNGKQSHKVDRTVVDTPMALYFSHRIGEWERPDLNLKQLPDDVEIDWVKAYK
jgi:beta-glucanase (GH16 family)